MTKYGQLQCNEIPSPQDFLSLLSPSHDNGAIQVEVILDSGARMTCLPEKIVDSLGHRIYTYKTIKTPSGKSKRKMYVLDIEFGGKVFENTRVIGLDYNYGLLGRDILNKFKIILDGPQSDWSLEND
jgi:predicted aspartyl protease